MLSGRFRALTAVVTVAVLAVIPLTGDQYLLYLFSIGMTYALAALGLNVLMGFGPVISLGHAGFFAVGAYTTGIALGRYELSVYMALFAAGIIGAAVGAVVALPALRLTGLYLAIGTLAFGLVVERSAASATEWTGGPNGLSVNSPFTNEELFYVILVVFVAMTFAYRNVVLGGFGDLLQGIRDHEIAAQSMGINIGRLKVSAFAFSALYAAIGGGLYACAVGYIVGASFALNLSLLFVLMVMLGGAGSVYGPILGAAFVVALPEVMKGANWGQDLIYGVVIVAVILFFPSGLAGVLKGSTGKGRSRPDEAGQPASGSPPKSESGTPTSGLYADEPTPSMAPSREGTETR